MVDDDAVEFFVPSNLDKFLFEYEHSAFLECNQKMAKSNLEKYGKSYAQNESRNKMISPVMQHISRKLESLGKHYWLAGGTLLGWYRDCGIIPHTQDVDMAVWANEYDNRIKRHFLGNKLVRLWGSLGLVSLTINCIFV
jgi:phosphorylcholine metabolism protein LicD